MVQFTEPVDGYEVYNLLGKKVLSGSEQPINVYILRSEIYLVQLNKDGALGTERLIAKH